MDIGGALALLAEERGSVEKCPLAQFAKALRATGAASTREAASAVLKAQAAELSEAELKLEQYEIARDKLRAELQRVDSLAGDAAAQRQRASTIVGMCKALLAAGFEDRPE